MIVATLTTLSLSNLHEGPILSTVSKLVLYVVKYCLIPLRLRQFLANSTNSSLQLSASDVGKKYLYKFVEKV